MRKITLPFLLFFALSFISQTEINQKQIDRFEFEKFLNTHEFSIRKHISKKELKKIPKAARPDLAYEQDFLATLDPALGYPPIKRLIPVYNQVQAANNANILAPGGTTSPWVERGPNNVGGRTRAIMYDPNDPTQKQVWAGGVSGGLWYNNDITNATSSWVSVNDFWDNLAITCIAYDPNDSSIFYVGTGEAVGKASRGGGIWKSTNGGSSWSQLTSTSNFYYVNDIVVRNESGASVIYAAIDSRSYMGAWHNPSAVGLRRSTDGGASWTQVMPNIPGSVRCFVVADIEIDKNNNLWVGTKATPYSGTDRGGGRVLKSTNGTTWSVKLTELVNNNYNRIEIACAPSNSNYIYAIVADYGVIKTIKQSTNGGTSWSAKTEPNDVDPGIPSTDFSRGQGVYCLTAAVDPNNPTTLIVGGINLFKSTNGGTSWNQLSVWQWSGAWNYQWVHADQQNTIYKPGSSSEVLFTTDGGVFYTDSISYAGINSTVIKERNKDYNTVQFYACTMSPNAGSNYFLAGTQDNQTLIFSNPGVNYVTPATGGDGGYCFIDQLDTTTSITSYIYNQYFISTNSGNSYSWMFTDPNTGKFINPTDYDNNLKKMYSARTASTILRLDNIGGTVSNTTLTIPNQGTNASHLRVSPYSTTSTTLFVGTEGGKLFKLTNANTNTFTTSNITSSSFPSGTISCIDIGSSENELIVTFSNYGVTSVWYTSNGGSSWVSKEGNLPDMPVRWALQNPNNSNEVILATEVGVWSTSNFSATSPNWSPSNSGLANVRVDMFRTRASDNEVIAATHGRGLFSSDWFSSNTAPTADFTSDLTIACNAQTVTLQDLSTSSPTSWLWTITPNTFTFKNGTNANSVSPEVNCTSNGQYSISLVVSNANGTDSIYKANYLTVGGATLPFLETWEDPGTVKNWKVVNLDNDITWGIYTVGGTSPGNKAIGIDNWNYSASQTTSQKDYLNTPPLNLTGYSSVTLNLDYAYQIGGTGYEDSLAIAVSTNCGSSWTTIAHYKETGGNNYVTRSASGAAFTPAVASDWCGSTGYAGCITVNLDAYAGMDNVRISFNNLSGYGNNLYLDNVSVTGTASSNTPVAGFKVDPTLTCIGKTVSLIDISILNPTSWLWSITPNTYSFTNGTNANSQFPKVTFSANDLYTVSLIASNSNGSDTATKTTFIQIGGATLPYTEDWEDPHTYKNWDLDNPDSSITWGPKIIGGTSPGNRAVGIDNWNYSASQTISQIDYLQSPPLNLTGYNSASLSFDYAYQIGGAGLEDSLAIAVSTNCGNTWTTIAHFREDGSNNYVTRSASGSAFIPAVTSDWCGSVGYANCITVNLDAFVGNDNVRISFNNLSGYGNNLYIDNIVVTGVQQMSPVAEFTPSSTNVCPSQSITLYDNSINSPTSWLWNITPNTFTYQNGTNASSQNPEVLFSAKGYYTISLIASNSLGSDTITKVNKVLVGGLPLPYLETWEDSTTHNYWSIVNLDQGITWALYNVGGNSPGNNAIGVDNWSYTQAQNTYTRDYIRTPLLDLSGYSSVTLTFDYAHIDGPVGYEDSLSVSVLVNCSYPWTDVGKYKENGTNNFNTRATMTSAFTPALAADWCGTSGFANCISVNLDAYAGMDNVKISFGNLSGNGNNLYLDNINVTGVLNASIVAGFMVNDSVPCLADTVTFTDLSSNSPTSWAWSITPASHVFVNGTNASSQNPQVAFNAMTNYSVTLIATASDGSDTLTKTNYIQVKTGVTAAVSISGTDTLCAGMMANYTATPSNGGATPVYQWKRNGNNIGTNSSILGTSVLTNGDKVWVEMNSSEKCVMQTTVYSDTITVTVNPSVTPSVSIASTADTICSGTQVTFTATPVNPGLAPTYLWFVNGSSVGTNSSTYSSNSLQSGDTVVVILGSSESCVTTNWILSNQKIITVNPIATPSVSISATADTICTGGSVTYTAIPVNGGLSPTYQWYLNGSLQAATNASFTPSSIFTGDSVYTILTTSLTCKTSTTATSTSIKTTVLTSVTPTISVAATNLVICQGEQVTFTVSFTNGGSNPLLQWRINGALNGITGSTFTSSSLMHADEVSCRITSNAMCAISTPVISNAETMLVFPIPTVTLTGMPDMCDNDAPVTLSNGNPVGGMYSGSGVSSGVFNPATAGLGTQTIKYVYTNSNGCKDSATTTVKVLAAPPKPTVIVNVLDLSTTAPTSFDMQWFFNGSAIAGATSNTYTVQFNGYYNLELSHPITKCSIWSDTIYFDNVSIAEIEKHFGLDIYPNPTDGIVNVDFEIAVSSEISIAIFDGLGQRAFSKTFEPDVKIKEEIDLSGYAEGVYLIHISIGERRITKRITLQ